MIAAAIEPPPGDLKLAQHTGQDAASAAAADHAARHWVSDQPGSLRPGTEAHKLAVARMFRETFNPYKPTIIDLSVLGMEERHRRPNRARRPSGMQAGHPVQ